MYNDNYNAYLYVNSLSYLIGTNHRLQMKERERSKKNCFSVFTKDSYTWYSYIIICMWVERIFESKIVVSTYGIGTTFIRRHSDKTQTKIKQKIKNTTTNEIYWFFVNV